jgi:hypothetical protein
LFIYDYTEQNKGKTNMTKLYVNISETEDGEVSSKTFDTLVDAIEWMDSDYRYTVICRQSTGLPIVKTIDLNDGYLDEYLVQIKQETAHRSAF